MGSSVVVRPLAARDSFDALTELLHRAYAPLAEQGMNFTAAAQTAEVTRRRAAQGQCFVAADGATLVGTVTVCGPYDVDTAPWTADVPWLREPDTAHFHQFAVAPSHQGHGVGRRLIGACEDWARASGYRRMTLDTALDADVLRRLYRRVGYVDVGQVQWEGRNYRSVIMRKWLDHSPLREHLQTMARYHAWATARCLGAVARLDDAAYRRDAGLYFGSVHGTLNHLLVGERLLWWRRFGGDAVDPASAADPPFSALDAEVERDRAQLAERLCAAAAAWSALIDAWPEDRLLGTLRYARIDGDVVTLPLAATLAHVFNHATHHRGQVSAALTAAGVRDWSFDLVAMLQQEEAQR